MKRINFQRFEMYMGIAKKECAVVDIREDFADILYNIGHGIKTHALAMKIYQSKGVEEYSEEECELIRQYSQSCSPAFIDSINNIFKDDTARK